MSTFRSTHQSGEDYEKLVGRQFHVEHVPVLISPLLLRKFGAGQVDLAYLDEEKIVLVEIKKNWQYFSSVQRQRLQQSQQLIAHVFEKDVVLRLV